MELPEYRLGDTLATATTTTGSIAQEEPFSALFDSAQQQQQHRTSFSHFIPVPEGTGLPLHPSHQNHYENLALPHTQLPTASFHNVGLDGAANDSADCCPELPVLYNYNSNIETDQFLNFSALQEETQINSSINEEHPHFQNLPSWPQNESHRGLPASGDSYGFSPDFFSSQPHSYTTTTALQQNPSFQHQIQRNGGNYSPVRNDDQSAQQPSASSQLPVQPQLMKMGMQSYQSTPNSINNDTSSNNSVNSTVYLSNVNQTYYAEQPLAGHHKQPPHMKKENSYESVASAPLEILPMQARLLSPMKRRTGQCILFCVV